MRNVKAMMAGIAAILAITAGAQAETSTVVAVPAEEAKSAPPAAIETGAPPEVMAPLSPTPPQASGLRQALERLAAGATDREAEERVAIAAFYDARQGAPVWITDTGLTAKGEALVATLAAAGDYGLDPADFALPDSRVQFPLTAEAASNAEATFMLAAMKYARFARGGRIMHPAQDLSSYLDRGPQLIEPKLVLAAFADSTDIGATLRGFHPQHPQFEKLRQVYLRLRGDPKGGKHGPRPLSADAKRVLANMEQWRWMPSDMGETYVWNNIPEFMQRVVHDGQVVRFEKIVAGLINKQTPIFSRPLKTIVFRPKWKVPESIKVREVWPSLLRGGGVMAQFGLQIETKDGQPVPIHSVNWATADIRNYEVIQPPGPHSILGVLKFRFPNQHTVFMHDTQDKHLFAASQRTYSHGCMRVKNPVQLAQILLGYDKGMDPAAVAELTKTGPLDNEVPLDHKIPVHITYFTAMVADDGSLKTFRDVYGHEKRIGLALEGRWSEIEKGRDHLAPVEPDMAEVTRAQTQVARTRLDEEPVGGIGMGGARYGSNTVASYGAAAVTPPGAARRGAALQPKPQKSFDLLGAVFGGGF